MRREYDPLEQIPSFNEARAFLLETLAREMNLTFSAVQREYESNDELRRRIDLAALDVTSPGSQSIH